MPGLPKNLFSTYQKYKNHTDSIAQWLATTAKGRGYVATKARKSGKKATTTKAGQTYTVAIKEWAAMAEFIAGLADPVVDVPLKLATLLDATISLRQSFSDSISNILEDTLCKKTSDDSHAFFLGVLKDVRAILTPRISKQVEIQPPSQTIKEASQTMKEAMNMFEHLELYDVSEAFEKSPDVARATAPKFKAERPNTAEDAYFAMYLLLQDLSELRVEVFKSWIAALDGVYDLYACSVACNVAVDLARSMVEELKGTFVRHGGIMRIYQIVCAARMGSDSKVDLTDKALSETRLHKLLHRQQRPEDDMNFHMYDEAYSVFWPTFLLLNTWCDAYKKDSNIQMKKGVYGVYDPRSNRCCKSGEEKFLEDKILLLEILSPFCLYHRSTKSERPAVEDEFTHSLRLMFETKEVTLPLVFATTLFLDVHHVFREKVNSPCLMTLELGRFVSNDIIEHIKFHAETDLKSWPKDNYYILQAFLQTLELWLLGDRHRESAPRMDRSTTREPYYLLRMHPWWCGLWNYYLITLFHELSVLTLNTQGVIMTSAHLLNAVGGLGQGKDLDWKDLELAIKLQGVQSFFVGDLPTTANDWDKRFVLALGVSAVKAAKSARTPNRTPYSGKGAKGLKRLGRMWEILRARLFERLFDDKGPTGIRTEDVAKIIDNIPAEHMERLMKHSNAEWVSTLKEQGVVLQRDKTTGQALVAKHRKTSQLSVINCVGLVRSLVQLENLDIAFDYWRMHRQCWRLLRAVADNCEEDLVALYGPDYDATKDMQPHSLVFDILSSPRRSVAMGGVRETVLVHQIWEKARCAIRSFVSSGAGAEIKNEILPKYMNIQFSRPPEGGVERLI